MALSPKHPGSSSVLVNREWAFCPPRLGSARMGPAGGSSNTCDPSIPLQLPGALASSPPASPKVTMTRRVLARFAVSSCTTCLLADPHRRMVVIPRRHRRCPCVSPCPAADTSHCGGLCRQRLLLDSHGTCRGDHGRVERPRGFKARRVAPRGLLHQTPSRVRPMMRRASAMRKGFVRHGAPLCSRNTCVAGSRVSPVRKMTREQRWGCWRARSR